MKKHRKKLTFNFSRMAKRLLLRLRRRTAQVAQSMAAGQTARQPGVPAELQRSSRKYAIRVKNMRRLIAVSGAVVVVVVTVVLVTSLGAPKPAVSGDNLLASADDLAAVNPAANLESIPTTLPESKVTLAMPVFDTFNIAEGVEATVVTDIQTRLMDLYYLDEDEPGTIYDETTTSAVKHFQAQHGLPVTGTVDQPTYDLLMSDQAQYYTITVGAEDPDVEGLQQRLYELGYIDKVTGYFGTDTESAVKKFQKLNGLSEDGKVGKDTREMLYNEDAKPNMYAYGEQSPEILTYQQRLKTLGYLTTEPDGTFGEDTKVAVRRFQESNGLIADGYIGPSTKDALMSAEAQGNALAIGAKGNDVTNVQNRLKDLGYIKKATGYYGEDTETAVRNFQKTNGLTVDGKIGRHTMNTLFLDSAKKYKKPASNNAGSSNNGSSSNNNSSGSSGGDSSSANITGANIDSFISVAESKIGKKYVRGAKGPNSFDCSGFVYWCLNQVGVKQGYMTSAGWKNSSKYTKIDNMGDMQRGDIIVFKGHVAVYAGGGVMIDASSSNGKVVKRSSTGSWCQRSFICAFRVF